jgi:creatinine amidohydrolase
MTVGLSAPDALAGRSWPEVGAMAGGAVLVLPVGSLEQHGPHLPLDTDTRVATELAHRVLRLLAPRVAPMVVAPAVAYGASGEHAGFPGTLSVGTRVLGEIVVELVRSARDAFAGVVVVSGHGGNADALRAAVRRCRSEGDRVLLTGWGAGGGAGEGGGHEAGDAHAGRTETSMMLTIDPAAVRLADAAAGRTEPLADLLAELRRDGVRAVSANGVLGDPAGASAAEGHRRLDAAAARIAAAVERWWTLPAGA